MTRAEAIKALKAMQETCRQSEDCTVCPLMLHGSDDYPDCPYDWIYTYAYKKDLRAWEVPNA